jgi:predicted ATPase
MFRMDSKYVASVFYQGGLAADSYLNDIAAIRYLTAGNVIDFDNAVTFLVGENGSGKSTIIEAIAVGCGFNLEGGSKNFNFSTRDAPVELADCLIISKAAHPKDGYFFRAESFFNAASYIEDIGVSGYGKRSLHEQSHGESFLALFQNRLRGEGLYLLDEPEAALSPTRQMSLIAEIAALVERDSQFIIATHSPILLAYPNASILELSESGIQQTTYRETQSYLLYKQFLDDPAWILKHLM